jgi:hypothetical protein
MRETSCLDLDPTQIPLHVSIPASDCRACDAVPGGWMDGPGGARPRSAFRDSRFLRARAPEERILARPGRRRGTGGGDRFPGSRDQRPAQAAHDLRLPRRADPRHRIQPGFGGRSLSHPMLSTRDLLRHRGAYSRPRLQRFTGPSPAEQRGAVRKPNHHRDTAPVGTASRGVMLASSQYRSALRSIAAMCKVHRRERARPAQHRERLREPAL